MIDWYSRAVHAWELSNTLAAAFFRFYNESRLHSSLGRDVTPMEVYRRDLPVAISA